MAVLRALEHQTEERHPASADAPSMRMTKTTTSSPTMVAHHIGAALAAHARSSQGMVAVVPSPVIVAMIVSVDLVLSLWSSRMERETGERTGSVA